MSAGARADYATQRATRTEQTVYLEEEKMWQKRAEWLKKKQPHLNNPAEASTAAHAGESRLPENTTSRSIIRRSARSRRPLRIRRSRPPLRPRADGVRSCIFFTTSRGRRRSPFSRQTNLIVDASDPTVMRGRFKIAKWFAPGKK